MAAASTVIVENSVAHASTASTDDAAAEGRGKPGLAGAVIRERSGALTVGAADLRATRRLTRTETVAYAGFPDHVVPRVGDHVVVVEDWPGHDRAAVPLCHWVEGRPRYRRDGTVVAAGETLVGSPLLPARHTDRVLSVRVLDTDLPTAQVLQVK